LGGLCYPAPLIAQPTPKTGHETAARNQQPETSSQKPAARDQQPEEKGLALRAFGSDRSVKADSRGSVFSKRKRAGRKPDAFFIVPWLLVAGSWLLVAGS
jgi:hypothetical protein